MKKYLLFLALSVGVALPALGQDGSFPVERLRPAMDRNGIIDVESADVSKHLNYDLGLWFNYNRNPLVIRQDVGGGAERVGALVQNRVGTNLTFALGLWEWVELGVDLPMVIYQNRDDVSGRILAEAAETVGTAFGLGDLRLSPKIRLLRAEDAFLDISIIPTITLPTNFPKDSFLGEGDNDFAGLTFAPELVVGRSFGAARFSVNLGYRLRGENTLADLTVGPEVFYRAGLAYGLDDVLSLPLELGVSVGGQAGTTVLLEEVNTNPLELMAGLTYNAGDRVQLFAGGGLGLIAGYSTPDFRLFGGLRYSPRKNDRDGDGLNDAADGCPDDAEDKDGFEDADGCPDVDNDGDGLLDADDKCPDVAEDIDTFEDTDGCLDEDNDEDGIKDTEDRCPLEREDKDGFEDEDGCADKDNDQDGVIDASDKCPLIPGVAKKLGCPDNDSDEDGIADDIDACPSEKGTIGAKGCPDKDGDGVADKNDKCVELAGDPRFQGCPDSDHDGIPSPQDKCPDRPENINGVKDDDGCPDKGKSKIKLTKERIEILEKVYFDSAKATIKSRSFNLLTQVASVLKAHPELTRVRVEGHTDSQGKDDYNLDLSNRRAESVMKFLMSKGVNPKQLMAQGFGETRPVADNGTNAGRGQNRRVEFVIVEVDGKPSQSQQIKTK